MNFTSRNEITGAWLKSKRTNDNYRDGFDAIFGKKEVPVEEVPVEEVPVEEVKAEDAETEKEENK